MSGHSLKDLNFDSSEWLSLTLLPVEKKDCFLTKHKVSGRLYWNTWKTVDYISSVPFVTGTEGYACFKIPAMLRTEAGTLLAFSEARKNGCGDFDETDIVYKRSTDGGRTWSDVKRMVEVPENSKRPGDQGVCGNPLVIGNVAPVQIRSGSKHHPGRILVPYTRNNFKVWITHSDDDGLTFSSDREIPKVTVTDETPDCNRNMTFFGYKIDEIKYDLRHPKGAINFVRSICDQSGPFEDTKVLSKLEGPWQFIGMGPPGSLQLRSGRILTPGYHSYIRGLRGGHGQLPVSQLYNDLAICHTMISDDGGDTWRLGNPWPRGHGGNENQLVQLKDGTVLSTSRSFSTGSPQFRTQARSVDDGETFTATTFAVDLPQPFNGCQGSSILGNDDEVLVAGPNPESAKSTIQEVANEMDCKVNLTGRSRMSVWRSKDGGRTYPESVLIDGGLSAQSSLQRNGEKIILLYEQADDPPETVENMAVKTLLGELEVLLPTRFVFREIPELSQEIGFFHFT
eukprot:TRINITY_DN73056_c0_g1_i1.p1 TRINITY_DN73056_c0_g1~~TRINITY_DN73056_c0_g1_i1.p1  ORF type:complete len:530 (-),score=84.67 TRINITY_DN73056_c0_g1_i1:35-1567(-)